MPLENSRCRPEDLVRPCAWCCAIVHVLYASPPGIGMNVFLRNFLLEWEMIDVRTESLLASASPMNSVFGLSCEANDDGRSSSESV